MATLTLSLSEIAVLAVARACNHVKLVTQPSKLTPTLSFAGGANVLRGSDLIVRYLGRVSCKYGQDVVSSTKVDFFLGMSNLLNQKQGVDKVWSEINTHLKGRSYLVGERCTIADYVIFEGLYRNQAWKTSQAYEHLSQWFSRIQNLQEVVEVSKKAKQTNPKVPAQKADSKPVTKEPAAPQLQEGDFKPTSLDYLEGTYVFEASAIFCGGTDTSIVLDRTIFHPQGGGQPTDIGVILGAKSGSKFIVDNVSKKGSVIFHGGKFEDPSKRFVAGEPVQLQIDEAHRRLCARLHSAGHLIDVAMTNVGFDFKPAKGYHFPSGSYVEYVGAIKAEEKEQAMKKLQDECDRLCKSGLLLNVVKVPYDEAGKFYDGKVPDFLPQGKPVRVVSFHGQAECPCGGTHVDNVADIEQVLVRKLEKKKKNVRVCYDVKR